MKKKLGTCKFAKQDAKLEDGIWISFPVCNHEKARTKINTLYCNYKKEKDCCFYEPINNK